MAKNLQFYKKSLGTFLLVTMMSHCGALASHAPAYHIEANVFIDDDPPRIPLNRLGGIRSALESPRWP